MSTLKDGFDGTMYLVMDKTSIEALSDLLMDELKKNSWSQSELARRAKVSKQVVSSYINKQREKPDEEILRALAKPLKMNPEDLFRVAGILPPVRDDSPMDKEISYLFKQLPDTERQQVLDYVRFMVEKVEARKK
jgi:transcriptional regulator with XRE-family HTH domain